MVEPSSRRAKPEDLAVVTELLGHAVAEGARRRGGSAAFALYSSGDLADPQVQAEVARAACSGEGPLAFLASFEGAEVGVALLRLVADGALVELAYVLEGARGVGVGESLLEALTGEARAHGARWLDALALPGDRSTKSLYERGGLVAREITLRRSLEE